jgi:hypothetical protein
LTTDGGRCCSGLLALEQLLMLMSFTALTNNSKFSYLLASPPGILLLLHTVCQLLLPLLTGCRS